MSEKAGLGKVVSVHYRGGIKGEMPIDDNYDRDPLTVMIGDMKLPRGIELALESMEMGEVKTVEVPAELGYGDYQDNLAQWYPKIMLKDGYNLKEGDFLYWTNPQDNSKAPAWVTETTSDQVKIDFNHPFAGKTLEYTLELVDIR